MRRVFPVLAMLVVFASVAPLHAAALAVVPEIDGGSLTAGLGILAGGVMILRARMRRNK